MCQNRLSDLIHPPVSWVGVQVVGTTVDATVSRVATE
jgi:hypothetical protein